MPRPRAAGSTSSRRSFASWSDFRTRNTEPTFTPSCSAIQQRSRAGSCCGEELAGDPRHQRLETGVEAVLLGVQRAVPRHHPADVAGRCWRSSQGAGRDAPSSVSIRCIAVTSDACAGSGSRASSAPTSSRDRASSGAKASRPASVSDSRFWRRSVPRARGPAGHHARSAAEFG